MKRFLDCFRLLLVCLWALAIPELVVAQNKTITGKISDASGGLPGASILVKGTTVGTVTDFDGNYTLEVPQGATLVVSFVGYDSKEFVEGIDDLSNIVLAEGVNLEEVMVIGYGTTTKKDATGSVTSLSEDDFNNAPSITAENLLQGRTTGVAISPNNGGAPGGGASIKIRGTGSLALTTEPLIIVDDVPLSFGNIGGSRNILESINPNDIESMTILKDASATAIYGSRASNGVIIITTKQGKLNQPLRVTADSKLMISDPKNTVPVMNAGQFTDFVTSYGSEDEIFRLGTSSTNWQDEIYRTAITTDNNVSITGSAGKFPIRASVGYIAQQGILDTDEMNRFTSSLNVAPSFFDNHLRTEVNAKYTHVANDFADRGAIGAAAAFDPTQSIYDKNGNYTTWYSEAGENQAPVRNPNTVTNPLMLLHAQEDLSKVNRFIGNAKFDYKLHFFPDLTATVNMGYDRASSTVEKYKKNGWIDDKTGRMNVLEDTEAMNENKLLDLYLNYNKSLDNHRINATGGYAYQSFYSENATQRLNIYTDESLNVKKIITPSKDKDVLISFFGRANYTYKDRYLFTATVRADASSKLNPDDRWGIFPSASFAWRVTEEDFMKNMSSLSNLKLRLGYGQMGNVGNLGNYKFLTRYTSSANDQAQYQVGDTFYPMYRPEVTNPNLRWEIGETYNAGVDYGFFDERVYGSLDYYIKDTRDLIAQQRLDPFTNFGSTVEANIGDIRNQGVEFAINYDVIRKETANWTVGFNASYNKNEITYLPNEELIGGISTGTGNNIQLRREGIAANSFYVYEQAYDKQGNPIENVFVDRNNDGEINEQDRYVHSNADPSWVLGFFTNGNYKNFDFSMTARANLDNYSYFDIAAGNSSYQPAFAHGSLSNRHTYFYNTAFRNTSDSQAMSDMFIQNASFFKLDNITIGYKISKDKLKFADIRVYGSVQNVLTLTKYDGVDPENGGIDRDFYTIPTIYTFGLTLNL